ncbi:hypothetical protein HMPREF1155_0476 [Slackia sp. CM382]|nr:hypothetical protein HMPREF1155_0476 [Slackia sp. CM382]
MSLKTVLRVSRVAMKASFHDFEDMRIQASAHGGIQAAAGR